MSDGSNPEKTSTPAEVAARGKRFFWQVGGLVALIALLGGAVIWWAHKRSFFSAVLQEGKAALHHLPAWSGLVVFGLIVLIIILWKVPQWQVKRVEGLEPKERWDRVNEARKTLATMLGGVVLLAGFFGTWQNLQVAQKSASTSQKALLVSQEGQITDRFTKAIEQLGAVDATGKKRLEVRLGGIYALERIAIESEKDHWPIMEVLCTYVRENAPRIKEESAKTNVPSHPLLRFSVDAVIVSTNTNVSISRL